MVVILSDAPPSEATHPTQQRVPLIVGVVEVALGHVLPAESVEQRNDDHEDGDAGEEGGAHPQGVGTKEAVVGSGWVAEEGQGGDGERGGVEHTIILLEDQRRLN